jgi:hypothetical protein
MHLVCNNEIHYDLSKNQCTQAVAFPPPSHSEQQLAIYMVYHDAGSFEKVRHLTQHDMFRLVKIPQNRYDESILFLPPIKPFLSFDARYTGTMLYSFVQKGACTDYDALIAKYPTADVFVFQWSAHNVLLDMRCHGSTAERLFRLILHKLGLNPAHFTQVPAVWKNCWLARTDIFKRYGDFVENAVRIMENDDECRALAHHDSKWKRNYSAEKLQAIYQRPYQTLHGFVVERLPAVFFETCGAKVQYVNVRHEQSHHFCT